MIKIYEKSEFDNSIRFKPSLISEDASINGLALDLMESMENELGLSFTRQRDLYVMNLTTILCNLLRAAKAKDKKWLAYSRAESNRIYKTSSKYNTTKLSYSRVTKLMDGLTALGMVEHQLGFKDRREGGSSRQTRALPTDNLCERMDGYAVNLYMVGIKVEPIVLRDKSKDQIDYTDTPTIRQMRSTLERLNDKLSTVDVCLGCTSEVTDEIMNNIGESNRWLLPDNRVQIDSMATSLYRVFNDEIRSKPRLTHGGRFYGHWVQSVPSKHRHMITIDEVPTCELDYSGLHINMLYNMAGLPLPDGDVYAVEGVELYRDAMKGILQCLINAQDREQAIAAIIAEHQSCPFIKTKDLEQAAQAFETKHESISQYFGTGIGTKLQRTDSDMAELIILELLDNDIVCLPIHDSFIVQADHEVVLSQAMSNASEKVLGIELKVDKKH